MRLKILSFIVFICKKVRPCIYDHLNFYHSFIHLYFNSYEEFAARAQPLRSRGTIKKAITSKWDVSSYLSISTLFLLQGSNTSLLTALAETIHASEEGLHQKLIEKLEHDRTHYVTILPIRLCLEGFTISTKMDQLCKISKSILSQYSFLSLSLSYLAQAHCEG